MTTPQTDPTAFNDKVFNAALGTMDTFNLYLGDRLGWFDALAEAPATAAELAERTKTQPRYAIEWLELMAVYDNLTVLDGAAGDRLLRRYALPPRAAEVLTDRHSDRARFTVADAAGLAELGPFDAGFAFECLHDMPRPVEVLAAIHDAVRSEGLVVIMDEAVADDFFAPGDPLEQVMYGYSTLICLPDGLSSTPSEATGTVMRRSILTDYAIRAGFASVQVLPIEDFAFFRFYRLHH
jgi:SAM-dependent methyltransferase